MEVLDAQRKHDEAEKAHRKAVEIDPKDANAWFGLGNNLFLQNKVEPALDALNKAADFDSKDTSIWTNLGAIFQQLDKNVEAEKAYRRAIKLDKKNATADCKFWVWMSYKNFKKAYKMITW